MKIKFYMMKFNNVHIKLSRTDDTYRSLSYRTNEANDWNADFFLSIHTNAFDGSASGYEDYIYDGLSSASEAAMIQDAIHEAVSGASGLNNRGQKKANFHVLRETRMPAVLTENGFIDNASDAAKMKKVSWLDAIAIAHAAGIAVAFNLDKAIGNNGTNIYVVKKGDTLSGIAKSFNTTTDAISDKNNISNVDLIHPGQRIKI